MGGTACLVFGSSVFLPDSLYFFYKVRGKVISCNWGRTGLHRFHRSGKHLKKQVENMRKFVKNTEKTSNLSLKLQALPIYTQRECFPLSILSPPDLFHLLCFVFHPFYALYFTPPSSVASLLIVLVFSHHFLRSNAHWVYWPHSSSVWFMLHPNNCSLSKSLILKNHRWFPP